MNEANRLGIDFITMLGMPPLDFVRFAATLDVHNISMALAPFTANPHGYAGWSLRDDAGLRRDLVAAQADHGVRIAVGEFVLIRPGSDVADAAADLAHFREIGAGSVNMLSIDADVPRSIDQIGRFADLAAAQDMRVTLEFMPGAGIGNFAKTLEVVHAVGRENLSVLVDCMHFARTGGVAAELAAADPALIGYVQLCDVSNRAVDASYGEEALNNRLAPGDGDIDLVAILEATSSSTPIGLEIPMRAKAEAGRTPQDYVGDAVAKARVLLARIETRHDV